MAVKLTELQVKNAKPRTAKYSMAVGNGLMMLVNPDGAKYWRLRYRIGGKLGWWRWASLTRTPR